MKAELMREMAEQMELEQKAKAYEKLLILLYNAFDYMMVQGGMDEEDISEYVGTDVAMVKAINDEDSDYIIRRYGK